MRRRRSRSRPNRQGDYPMLDRDNTEQGQVLQELRTVA